MQQCSFCGLPPIAICARCGRPCCPDHVQFTSPYMICFECEQVDPGYLLRLGELTPEGLFFVYQTGETFETIEYSVGKKFSYRHELWKIIEEGYEKQGMNVWTEYQEVNTDPLIIKELEYRKMGIHLPGNACGLITKEVNEGNLDRALEVANDCLEIWPKHPDILFLRAVVYEKQEKIQSAIEDYQSIITQFPQHPIPYKEKFRLLMVSGAADYQAMRKELDYLTDLGVNDAGLNFISGVFYARRVILFGELEWEEKALNELEKSSQMNPENNPMVNQLRGFIALVAENEDQAVIDLVNAKEIMGPSYCDFSWML